MNMADDAYDVLDATVRDPQVKTPVNGQVEVALAHFP
jgi:hypothetical protein